MLTSELLRSDIARAKNQFMGLRNLIFGSYAMNSRTIFFFLLMFSFSSGVIAKPSFRHRAGSDLLPLTEEKAVMIPTITTRFSNPTFNCNNDEYCLDVQFQSNQASQELFGMNVRFFYDDALLELINFRGFLGGYGSVAPHPPQNSYSANAGPQWFSFSNGSDYINGAVQLVNENAPAIFISTTGWTKLFQVCFLINEPNIDLDQFCPPIVWDLEANPANGSFFVGSDGVVMTVANPSGGSLPANEAVNQFNWVYAGSGGAPYGNPYEITCSSVNCLPVVTCPPNVVVACSGSTMPAQLGTATAIDFCANGDPAISYTDAFSGGTCPTPNLIIRTWAATDNCGNIGTCQQFISVGANMCTKIVSSTANNGAGTLRYAIECSNPGDTITFSTAIAGGTINISGSRIVINKNLYIRSNVTPRIKVNSAISGLFEINPSFNVEFKDLDITSGLTYPGNLGAAFKNEGTLKLIGMKVYRNTNVPNGQYLIRNRPGSLLQCFGNCFIEIP